MYMSIYVYNIIYIYIYIYIYYYYYIYIIIYIYYIYVMRNNICVKGSVKMINFGRKWTPLEPMYLSFIFIKRKLIYREKLGNFPKY